MHNLPVIAKSLKLKTNYCYSKARPGHNRPGNRIHKLSAFLQKRSRSSIEIGSRAVPHCNELNSLKLESIILTTGRLARRWPGSFSAPSPSPQ